MNPETKRSVRMKRSPRFVLSAAVILAISAGAASLYAVRANWGVRQAGPGLERLKRWEDAAFFYRAGLDFYAIIHRLWIDDAVYDERGDAVYRNGAAIFGDPDWRSQDHEERWDTIAAYIVWFNRNGLARCVEQGNFSGAQRARLEERARIYIEDLIDPDTGFGGDFSFARKAWILERQGLFEHASYRRELAGRYMIRVCGRYCTAAGEEADFARGDRKPAGLYRTKAAWWRKRGLDELRLANGDRILAQIAGPDRGKRMERADITGILEKGLQHANADARWTSAWLLADLGETRKLEAAMKSADVAVRKLAAEAFARRLHLPGLLLALHDDAEEVQSIAKAVLDVTPDATGPWVRMLHALLNGLDDARTRDFAVDRLRRLGALKADADEVALRVWAVNSMQGVNPGARIEYFSDPAARGPAAAKLFDVVDIGMRFRANFPKRWYELWEKRDIFAANAKGPFRVRVPGKLYVPADGDYRFYLKTEAAFPATLTLEMPDGKRADVISRAGLDARRWVMQTGMETHRIDYSEPVRLKKGMVPFTIEYAGEEVRRISHKHLVRISGEQKAGLQFFWSSDRHLTELVPAENLFH